MDKPCHPGEYVEGCVACWKWEHDPRYAKFRNGPTAPPVKRRAALPCIYEGTDVPGTERNAAGLDHRRKWIKCLHPEQPLGPNVCKCQGCGPKCSGYIAEPTDADQS
jgi:hypothetical protein